MVWTRFVRVPVVLGAAACGCGGGRDGDGLKEILNYENMIEDGQTSELKLKHAQVFFRHGARTPIHLIPNVEQAEYKLSFHNKETPHTMFKYKLLNLTCCPAGPSPFEDFYGKTRLCGGCVLGQLTPKGQQQMFDLGRRLKRFYVHKMGLMDGRFRAEEIYVRSTNINRTIASARCVLAGIFGAEELNSSINVVIHAGSVSTEVLLPNPHNCALVKTLNHAALLHFDNIPGIKFDRLVLERVLGIDSKTTGDKLNFIDVRDDLAARQAHGWPVPPQLKYFVQMIEKNATTILFHAMCGGHDETEKNLAIKMTAGPALTLAVDEMKDFVVGKSQRKLCLYSCHDSMILPLLVIFGIYDGRWPPFTADIRIEIYEDMDRENWVRVLYLGKPQKIRGCKHTLCKYSDFLEAMAPYLIDQPTYRKLCSSNFVSKLSKVHDRDEKDTEHREETPLGL